MLEYSVIYPVVQLYFHANFQEFKYSTLRGVISAILSPGLHRRVVESHVTSVGTSTRERTEVYMFVVLFVASLCRVGYANN